MFRAFVVALLAEMYGFPLSVYLMSGLLMHVHLVHTEEVEARLRFGDAEVRYVARVPGWFPHFDSRRIVSGMA